MTDIIAVVSNDGLFRPAILEGAGRVRFDLLGCDSDLRFTTADAAKDYAERQKALAVKAMKVTLAGFFVVGLIVAALAMVLTLPFMPRLILGLFGGIFVALSGGCLAFGYYGERRESLGV